MFFLPEPSTYSFLKSDFLNIQYFYYSITVKTKLIDQSLSFIATDERVHNLYLVLDIIKIDPEMQMLVMSNIDMYGLI